MAPVLSIKAFLVLCVMQCYILMCGGGEEAHEGEPKQNSQVFVCMFYLRFSCFYKVYIFFECRLKNTFMVGSVLLLIGPHCECALSLYLYILLIWFTH